MRGGATCRIKRAIETLRSDLTHDPVALRRYALELVSELGEGGGAGWYELGMVDGNPMPVRSMTCGPGLGIGTQLEERIPWPSTDPRLPPRNWDRSFVSLSTIFRNSDVEFRSTRIYERVWRPSRLEDQLRMVVYHRGEHVAWIGALRYASEPRFGRPDRRRLLPVAGALADALVTARAVERTNDPEEGGDLLIDARGVVSHASRSGRAWMERVAEARRWLRQWARAADSGAPLPACVDGRHVRWSRLLSAAGGVRYLLHLERTDPVRVHPSFVLSRMQREVAQLAAAGATATEIARMYGVTPATVRAHVKQIYELLEISSRAELGGVVGGVESFVEGHATLGELRAFRTSMPTGRHGRLDQRTEYH